MWIWKKKFKDNEKESEEDGDDDANAADVDSTNPTKKKKKKKNKKKATDGSAEQNGAVKKQTDPPSIPVCELYPDGNFPIGEIQSYPVPKDMDG